MAVLPQHADIVVVGAGPVGALLAQRLAQSGQKVLLCEARQEVAADARFLALSYHSRELLGNVGLWSPALKATSIQQVQISQQIPASHQAQLDAMDLALPELGCVVSYAELVQSLQAKLLLQPQIQLCLGARVTQINPLHRYASVCIESGTESYFVTARLVVLAEGGRLLEQLPQAKLRRHAYGQQAVVAVVQAEQPQGSLAVEHFAQDGALALLPHGAESILVWALPSAQAEAYVALPDAEFLEQVNQRLRNSDMTFNSVTSRHTFPLSLKVAAQMAAPRVVCLGNAAQTLHPVAGQGLNLGLRDADTLGRLLVGAADPGDAALLARYQRLRGHDQSCTVMITDFLANHLLSPNKTLYAARDMGILAIQKSALLRRHFTRRMVHGFR